MNKNNILDELRKNRDKIKNPANETIKFGKDTIQWIICDIEELQKKNKKLNEYLLDLYYTIFPLSYATEGSAKFHYKKIKEEIKRIKK